MEFAGGATAAPDVNFEFAPSRLLAETLPVAPEGAREFAPSARFCRCVEVGTYTRWSR